jgi:hypothetical protein
MSNRRTVKYENWFFDRNGHQRHWFVILGVLLPIVLTIVFSIWGMKISYDSANNTAQIDSIGKLIIKSQDQVYLLQKIFIATDSTNKATTSLKELPNKIARLGSTLDTLNFTLVQETKRLEKSYGALNTNYDLLIEQQKGYLDKISRVVELTNTQIKELEKNNQIVNEELTRRANIQVFAIIRRVGNKNFIEKIRIANTGNIECDVENLYIVISNKDFVSSDTSKQDSKVCMELYKPNTYSFKKDCTPRRVNKGLTIDISFPFGCYFTSDKLDIQYRLTYSNKYENNTIDGRPTLTTEP